MLIKRALPDYASLMVEYDDAKNPFFEAICREALKMITSKALGKRLLSEIGAAKPQSRADFPLGINIILRPLAQGMVYNQSGFKPNKVYGDKGKVSVTGMSPSAHAGHNLKDAKGQSCRFWKDGTSLNDAVDKMATGKHIGSVCYVGFSNAQFLTSKGESCVAFIVLAHELIHSLHCLEGMHMGDDEEIATAGQGKYANDPMTESAFRRLFGLPVRAAY